MLIHGTLRSLRSNQKYVCGATSSSRKAPVGTASVQAKEWGVGMGTRLEELERMLDQECLIVECVSSSHHSVRCFLPNCKGALNL